MTDEEKEQLIENDLFLDKQQLEELDNELYTHKMDNEYLKRELEIYNKALYLACNQLNDIYGYRGTSEVVDNFILKATLEIDK